MDQTSLPHLQELDIGTLNAVRFRIVPIFDPLAAKSEATFPSVHLRCLPQMFQTMDLDHLNKWSITLGSIIDLLRLRKSKIIEHFLPSCTLHEVAWKISIFEGYGIIRITIVAGHPKAVL
ncbi:MAG: hypothetical protein WAW13_00175 [Minisyncoccia bacterium]